MSSETEENKTEEATPFKLREARERGTIAKGADLGFMSMLGALLLVMLALLPASGVKLTAMMATTLQAAGRDPGNVGAALGLFGPAVGPSLQMVLNVALAACAVIITLEVIQMRGLVFSGHPLKPDMSRLNPAKGLKRLFSVKMLKETLKNVLKMIIYSLFAIVVTVQLIGMNGRALGNAGQIVDVLYGSAVYLVAVFLVAAMGFALIDQIISRAEFAKEMRMSHSEVKRENKDHEGEPRQKQKRRQLHAQYIKQTQQLSGLGGSDMLIVNPQHYAVALGYDASQMAAPKVTAKGRNRFALLLKERAIALSIPIIVDPPLARALYGDNQAGDQVRDTHFAQIARHYLAQQRLNRDRLHQERVSLGDPELGLSQQIKEPGRV
jgi:flagellar biosynthesis protein FlhB